MLLTEAFVDLWVDTKAAMQPFHCLVIEHCFVAAVVARLVCNIRVCALLTSSYKCL